jgi:hypothetical protein
MLNSFKWLIFNLQKLYLLPRHYKWPRPAMGGQGLGPQVWAGGWRMVAWRSRTLADRLPAHTGAIAHPGQRRTAVAYGNLLALAPKNDQ